MQETDTGGRGGRLLVVDDEPNICALLSATLRLTGFEVRVASGGHEALLAAEEFRPDLVVLDVMLPDLDGFQVAQRLRASGCPVPVLFLTARDAVEDRISGLTVGADDYVTKPFSLEEVVLRIRAILRRSRGEVGTADDGVLRYADLEMDEDAHEVRRAGKLVELSPTEFNLLRYLLINAGRVVSKAQILDRVWSYDFGGDGRIVESYVYYLRRKIDKWDPPLIHTVRGVGYALRLPRSDDGREAAAAPVARSGRCARRMVARHRGARRGGPDRGQRRWRAVAAFVPDQARRPAVERPDAAGSRGPWLPPPSTEGRRSPEFGPRSGHLRGTPPTALHPGRAVDRRCPTGARYLRRDPRRTRATRPYTVDGRRGHWRVQVVATGRTDRLRRGRRVTGRGRADPEHPGRHQRRGLRPDPGRHRLASRRRYASGCDR